MIFLMVLLEFQIFFDQYFFKQRISSYRLPRPCSFRGCGSVRIIRTILSALEIAFFFVALPSRSSLRTCLIPDLRSYVLLIFLCVRGKRVVFPACLFRRLFLAAVSRRPGPTPFLMSTRFVGGDEGGLLWPPVTWDSPGSRDFSPLTVSGGLGV